MLSRADYPSVWGRRGYPQRPVLPALFGDVIHRSLELILNLLHDQGCESVATICAVQALRSKGGYSKIAERAIEEVTARLEGNPRIEPQLSYLRAHLRQRLPEIRQRIQALIARSSMVPAPNAPGDTKGGVRVALRLGSHPEVELRAPDLRFMGRADLITVRASGVEITDYKSGAHDEDHAEQLRTYALLWTCDRDLNPTSLPVDQLTLAYVTADEHVPVPSESDLAALEATLRERAHHTESLMDERPPPAYPSPATCTFCPVRHLCDEYWGSIAPETIAAKEGFVDCEALVMGANGPRSWRVDVLPGGNHGLFLVQTETVPFAVGDRLRLLDVVAAHDQDTGALTVSMSQSSEMYVLRSEEFA